MWLRAQETKERRGPLLSHAQLPHTLTAQSPPGGPYWRRKEAICAAPRSLPLPADAPLSSAGGLQLAAQKATEMWSRVSS